MKEKNKNDSLDSTKPRKSREFKRAESLVLAALALGSLSSCKSSSTKEKHENQAPVPVSESLSTVPTSIAGDIKIELPSPLDIKDSTQAPFIEALPTEDCFTKEQGIRVELPSPNDDGYYQLSGEMKELNSFSGCNYIVEGREDNKQEHHIWVLTGKDWNLKVIEGSLWVYPADWNMDNFLADKAPIASEFAVAKRNNMSANDYDWPIIVHTLSGNTVVFPAGSEMPELVLPDNAAYEKPEYLTVHGILDAETNIFTASIGAQGTMTVALIDGQPYYWTDAKDNINYKLIEAYIMPSTYSLEDISKWSIEHFGEAPKLLR